MAQRSNSEVKKRAASFPIERVEIATSTLRAPPPGAARRRRKELMPFDGEPISIALSKLDQSIALYRGAVCGKLE